MIRSDLPDLAVKTVELSKRYQIVGAYSYKTLRDTVARAVSSPFRRDDNGRGTSSRTFVWALSDVSLDIPKGEIVGIIGDNGAGKTTLLKILSRITEPTKGYAEIHGRVGSLLNVGTGFHPELTGRENVFLSGSILGMKKAEISAKFDEIVGFAEVRKFVDTPVKFYSSGMYVRLAFAVAAHLEPDILLVDEVLAVGDVAFQRKCLGKMNEVAREGRTVLHVSHNMGAILSLCERACLLERGKVVRDGNARAVVEDYLRSVTSTADIPLDQREDRTGDGSARLVSLRIENAAEGKAISTMARLKITVGYRSQTPVSYPKFQIWILDYANGGIFELDSDAAGGLPEVIPSKGNVICLTEPINITPGRCYVDICIFRAEIQADSIDNAGYFDVFPDDFYGTGKLPDRESAMSLVRHRWVVGQ